MSKVISIAKKLLVLGFIFSAGCDKEVEKNQGRPPVPVVVTKAVGIDFPVNISSVGRCRAYNEVHVVSEVSGEVIAIEFEEGAFVEKGQLLFCIDAEKYQATLDSAEAELDRSNAQLSIDQVQLDRSKSLITKDYISKQEFDTYLARVEQDKAVIAAAQAAITRAKIDRDHCFIKAPISGAVGKRLVDRGAVVNSMQQLVTICQMSPLSVDFFVSENDFPELRHQFEARDRLLDLDIALIADKSIREKGVLKFLDNKIDFESGVISLKGEVENSDLKFWPGSTVRLKIELDIIKNAVVVPMESIRLNNDGKPYLYLVKEEPSSATKYRASCIYPEMGYQNEEFAEIKKGIQLGDMVILRGNMLLGNGSDVIPIPDADRPQ